jgi:hypothetical protein
MSDDKLPRTRLQGANRPRAGLIAFDLTDPENQVSAHPSARPSEGAPEVAAWIATARSWSGQAFSEAR